MEKSSKSRGYRHKPDNVSEQARKCFTEVLATTLGKTVHYKVKRASRVRMMGKMQASKPVVGLHESHNFISLQENNLKPAGL